MACSFCITEDMLSIFSFDQAIELLEKMKGTPINNVVIGGGEPFSWNYDLIGLTQEAKKRSFFVQIGTNGVDLPKGYEYFPNVDRYVLPLESVHEDTHNTMRIYNNEHHSIIMNRLDELKKADKSVTVSTVVTKENISELRDLAKFLKEYNEEKNTLHAWHLYKFVPEGRGGRLNAPKLEVSMQDYDTRTNELKNSKLGFHVYRRKDMFDSKNVEFFWLEHGRLKSTGKIVL